MKISSVQVFFAVISTLWCCTAAIEGRHSPGVGVVNEGQQFDHEAFDQEMLAGGAEQRQKLSDLSPEERAQEIRKLMGRIDGNADGKLGKKEIVAWLKKVEDHSYKSEANELFAKEDTNDDGFITFEEFWRNSQDEDPPEDMAELNEAQDGMGARFQSADTNKDGRLDSSEFLPFIHPFRYEHMVEHLVEDQLMLYDSDQDGKISLEEFTNSFNPEGLPQDELPEWVETEQMDFKTRYDNDQDGFLGHEEIKKWMAPDEDTFHEEEAQHVLTHADKNQDGFLTLEEIEAEFDVFAESAITDYGHIVHEEL